MSEPSRVLRDLVDARRSELDAVLAKYGAVNPRLFGSVARGDATASSDLDVLAAELLRDGVSQTALADAVAL